MRIALVLSERAGEAGRHRFFAEVLEGLGEVVVIAMPRGRLGMADDGVVARFLAETFDLWVFWQAEAVAARLVPFGLRGAVIVPSGVARADAFWGQFVASRFAVFSFAMQQRLQGLDARSALFEYWPEPGAVGVLDPGTAFFRERRPFDVPNVASVAQQCAALGIARLFVHAAPDEAGDGGAGYEALETLSGVALSSAGAAADVSAQEASAQFVFAPAREAGIADDHLAAMGRGQVVIGPDVAPLNEAVGHLSSGVLYDPERPLGLAALPSARVAELSEGARWRAVEGRRDWLEDLPRLSSFLRADGERWPAADRSAAFVREIQRSVHRRVAGAGAKGSADDGGSGDGRAGDDGATNPV